MAYKNDWGVYQGDYNNDYSGNGEQLKNWLNQVIGEPTKKIFNGETFNTIFNGLTGVTSANAARDANAMNIANQNYWNEVTMRREDTAHQREVADLQAAGLNPWLSMGNGANSVAMNTAQVDAVDGSKILSATTGMALLALTKLLLKK